MINREQSAGPIADAAFAHGRLVSAHGVTAPLADEPSLDCRLVFPWWSCPRKDVTSIRPFACLKALRCYLDTTAHVAPRGIPWLLSRFAFSPNVPTCERPASAGRFAVRAAAIRPGSGGASVAPEPQPVARESHAWGGGVAPNSRRAPRRGT